MPPVVIKCTLQTESDCNAMSFICESYRSSNNSLFTPIFCQPQPNSPIKNFSWASSALRSLAGKKDDSLPTQINVGDETQSSRLAPENCSLNSSDNSVPAANVLVESSNTSSNSSAPVRKSLSARYLESKQQHHQDTLNKSPNSQMDSCAELNTLSDNLNLDCAELTRDDNEDENTSISSIDSLNIVEEYPDFQPRETMFATECGPVRQSLLNLVLHDDIPDLMQAMAEDLHFVFDDYTPMQPTSGIILNGSKKRNSIRKQSRTNRICFDNESPKVFTYLDETSALTEGWVDGHPISYEDYLKLAHDAQDQMAKPACELLKWKNAMKMKFSESDDIINKAAASQLPQGSLQLPSSTSPLSSRTPTPDEIDRFGTLPPSRYTFDASTTSRPIAAVRQECGTSAI